MEQSDERLKKELGVTRRTREQDDREVVQDREVDDDVFLDRFRHQMFSNKLPNIPDIPGFHVCWLSTQNQYDPLIERFSIGYQPIKPEEVPGLVHASIQTGDYAGMIGVNEMIACKIKDRLYQQYMRENHHDAPKREEEGLAARTDALREEAEQSGGRIVEEEGMADLRRYVPAPVTFD